MERDRRTPQYIPIQKWNETHVQIMGQSGLGKGVTATQLLSQSLYYNHAVIVIDPKGDKWTPNALRDQAEKYNRPFHVIDLNKDCPQFNLLKGLGANQVQQLFEAGFDLADDGNRGTDHYKRLERDVMKKVIGLYRKNPTNITALWQLFKKTYPDIDDGFTDRFEEVAKIPVVNTNEGVDFRKIIEQGGCIYVIGSTELNHLRILQRMITLKVTILIKDTADTGRPHVTMFLDELKHCLSNNVINSFGMVRSFDANIICAHQSLGDLKSIKNLDGDAVYGAVVDNTGIKFIFRQLDPFAKSWASGLTGKTGAFEKVVSTSKHYGKHSSSGTNQQNKRHEVALIDENTVGHLLPEWSVLIGLPRAEVVKASKLPTQKRPLPIETAPIAVNLDDISPDDEDEI